MSFYYIVESAGNCRSLAALEIVPDCLVQLPHFEGLVVALRDLTNNTGRLASNNAEAGYDHVGRDDGVVEDPDVFLDDGELADDDVVADMDVGADGGGLDNGALADKDVFGEAHRQVMEGTER
jgi:hypothetical protein